MYEDNSQINPKSQNTENINLGQKLSNPQKLLGSLFNIQNTNQNLSGNSPDNSNKDNEKSNTQIEMIKNIIESSSIKTNTRSEAETTQNSTQQILEPINSIIQNARNKSQNNYLDQDDLIPKEDSYSSEEDMDSNQKTSNSNGQKTNYFQEIPFNDSNFEEKETDLAIPLTPSPGVPYSSIENSSDLTAFKYTQPSSSKIFHEDEEEEELTPEEIDPHSIDNVQQHSINTLQKQTANFFSQLVSESQNESEFEIPKPEPIKTNELNQTKNNDLNELNDLHELDPSEKIETNKTEKSKQIPKIKNIHSKDKRLDSHKTPQTAKSQVTKLKITNNSNSSRPKTAASPKPKKNYIGVESSYYLRRTYGSTKNSKSQPPSDVNSNSNAHSNSPLLTNSNNDKDISKSKSQIDSISKFRKEILKEETPRPKTNIRYKQYYESTLTQESLDRCVKNILIGKKLRFDNPKDIADIIDDLTNIQVTSMAEHDYLTARKAQAAIGQMRLQFRSDERDSYHQSRINALKQRIAIIESDISNEEQRSIAKIQARTKKSKEELDEMKKNHIESQIELQELWQTPEKMRRFSKKSAGLLNTETIERKMALIGDFDEAHEMKKYNTKVQQIETANHYETLKESYEFARTNLLAQQELEIGQLTQKHNLLLQNVKRDCNDTLNSLKARLNAVKSILEDEGKSDNFFARKFKNNPETIRPMSCSVGRPKPDIPVQKNMPKFDDADYLAHYQIYPHPQPLTLPTLPSKKIKLEKSKNKTNTPRKQSHDF